MHSRDTTVLIDLHVLWFNVVHFSSLFQYFFLIYYSPYSSWKFRVLVNIQLQYMYSYIYIVAKNSPEEYKS